jgi:hypothetical protein
LTFGIGKGDGAAELESVANASRTAGFDRSSGEGIQRNDTIIQQIADG